MSGYRSTQNLIFNDIITLYTEEFQANTFLPVRHSPVPRGSSTYHRSFEGTLDIKDETGLILFRYEMMLYS